jgi:serine/threonine-protein kinase
LDRFNITEPCALDNDLKLCADFGNREQAVPAYYLFDIEGKLNTCSTAEDGLVMIEDKLEEMILKLRSELPFCRQCQLFLDKEAMFCSECGLPLVLPTGEHPYYEHLHTASLPTVRLKDPDPLIGHLIDGKYELTAKLGEGGMSVVYRARRVHIGDEVAVKILLRKFITNDGALARFRREARAAAMLHHPNVITIHDFGETGEENAPAYIVMEFVKGTPLRDLLETEKHFSPERALRLMRSICAGVGSAHRQGVIHRDLKPENIIVVAPDEDNDFESVRVLDFGLAKMLADAHTGTVVGTPYYMSPEQCLGDTLDARSDVYSLGAMLYEMLAGQRPFTAETVSGVINKHLYEDPPPLPATVSISRRVSTAIMRALAKDPDQRPQTASELARQL